MVSNTRYHSPSILEMFTTRPRAFLIRGRKVLVTSIIPHRLISAVRLNCSIGIHSIGPVEAIPALFTSPHRPELKKFSIECRKYGGTPYNGLYAGGRGSPPERSTFSSWRHVKGRPNLSCRYLKGPLKICRKDHTYGRKTKLHLFSVADVGFLP